MNKIFFSVSIVIPSYNSERVLGKCLQAISIQDYPKDRIEIIVVDGFSKDSTRTIAGEYGAIIIDNPDVAHPMGRPLGILASKSDLVLCLDTDNILPDSSWLGRMVLPFEDSNVVGSEPIRYEAREQDDLITRYCALLGGDDPIIVYMGFHDRYSQITSSWTGVRYYSERMGGWEKVRFHNLECIPSLGANGCIFRKSALIEVNFSPFFHIDVSRRILDKGSWAKVDVGIIHMHGDTISKFLEKKKRRVERRVDSRVRLNYSYPISIKTLSPVLIRALLVFPIIMDSFICWIKCKDIVWLVHPYIFYRVLFLYSVTYIKRKFISIASNSYEKV